MTRTLLIAALITGCAGQVVDCTQGTVTCEDYWCQDGAAEAAACCSNEGAYEPTGATENGWSYQCVEVGE